MSEEGLAICARGIGLGEFVQLGKSEITSKGHERASTLADGFEALIGAIFLDSDFLQSKEIVLRLAEAQVETAIHAPESMNPKGALQESPKLLVRRALITASFIKKVLTTPNILLPKFHGTVVFWPQEKGTQSKAPKPTRPELLFVQKLF